MCIKYFKNTETNKHVATDGKRCIIVLLQQKSRSIFIYDYGFIPPAGFEPSTPEEFNSAIDVVDCYKTDFMAKQKRGINALLPDADKTNNDGVEFKLF